MKASGREDEQGQIVLLLAVGICMVVLGATALAVDWGNGMLQKRRLQSTADAAALAAAIEVNRGGSTSSAVGTAQTIVSNNTGGAVSLPYPGTGSGTSLTQGIEISSTGEVRVAIQRQVNTYFAPILGIKTLTIAARSRAIVGPEGVMPIAVKRFSGGDTSVPLGSGGNPTTVEDYLAPANSDAISSWPSPLSSSPPVPASYTAPDAYNPAVSGAVMPLVGQNALANVANGNDFHFFVAPDVRDITHVTPTFYNGVTASTSIQQLKAIESAYFVSGYTGENAFIGQQIGVFSGANTSQTVDVMRTRYQRGSIVTAMVYDGTVYRKPDFSLQLDSAVKTSSNIGPGGSPITFQVTLVPENNFTSSGVQFSATGLEGWADWQFGSGGLNTPTSLAVSGGNATISFTVSSSSVVQGARTALIRAYDPSTGDLRTASATVVVGSGPVFSLSCSQGFQVVEQGSSTSYTFDLEGWNGYPTSDVTINAVGWYTNDVIPQPSAGPSGVTLSTPILVKNVKNNQNNQAKLNLSIDPNASTGEWSLLLKASDRNSADDQLMYVTLEITNSNSGPSAGNTTSFVQVLGYANFVITYGNNASSPNPSVDNNTIYAYAVSGLVSDVKLLPMGLSPRLISWNQVR